MAFRDVFALVVWTTSTLLYVMVALGYSIPEVVLGQMLALDTLVVQFYFRKKPGAAQGGGRNTSSE